VQSSARNKKQQENNKYSSEFISYMIFTFREFEVVRKAIEEKKLSCEVSLDIGLSKSTLSLDHSIIFPDGQQMDKEYFLSFKYDERTCYLVEDGRFYKIQLFSTETNRLYKLVNTKTIPTIEISGIRMHRIYADEPLHDTETKINAIKPVHGSVLDTCTGLGYTAIAAAKQADSVITIEKDANVIKIARYNPHSRELFTNKKIKLIIGDVTKEIKGFEANTFDIIIHDPPTFLIAGELYSEKFYKELYRVLKRKGTLFHYTGVPGWKKRRRDLPLEVSIRLKKAGFADVKKCMSAAGVVAKKL